MFFSQFWLECKVDASYSLEMNRHREMYFAEGSFPGILILSSIYYADCQLDIRVMLPFVFAKSSLWFEVEVNFQFISNAVRAKSYLLTICFEFMPCLLRHTAIFTVEFCSLYYNQFRIIFPLILSIIINFLE